MPETYLSNFLIGAYRVRILVAQHVQFIKNLQRLKIDGGFSEIKVSVLFPTPSRPYPNYYE
jgi:hypothetical protein